MLNPLTMFDKPKRKEWPTAAQKSTAIMKGLQVLRSVKGSKDYPIAAKYASLVNRYVGYEAIDPHKDSLDFLDMKRRSNAPRPCG